MSHSGHDVCVIGAGPAGLAASLRLADLGLRVLLVESGSGSAGDTARSLSAAEIETPQSHADMADAVHRGPGGTSALWGGRCVPLDPLDFEARAHVPRSGWPIRAGDLEPFLPAACEFLAVGPAHFEVARCRRLPTAAQPLAEGLGDGHGLRATQLERWSTQPRSWQLHGTRVRRHPRIELCLGWTCVRLDQTGAVVSTAVLVRRGPRGVERLPVRAAAFVLACGGIESTRLVLHSLQAEDGLRLESPGLVGRFYMGHPSGKIADIVFAGAAARTIHGFERDGEVYVRRRITLDPALLASERLLNVAFWLDNPPLHDPGHGSGVLSAAYLALSAPVLGPLLAPSAVRKRQLGGAATSRARHWRNCLRRPLATAGFCARFVHARYLRRPALPGFFTSSPANRYALHYHAEQAPDPDNRIVLADARDELGMRKARIALRWSERDVDSVVAAHRVLQRCLNASGAGALHWRHPEEDLPEAVRVQAVDGYHQLGTLRMSADRRTAVADEHGRLYGTRNLFAATSAVFPTSGQANPTLALVAFVLRQAEAVARAAGGQTP